MAAGLLRSSALACRGWVALLALGSGLLGSPGRTAPSGLPVDTAGMAAVASCREAIGARDLDRLRDVQEQLLSRRSPRSTLLEVLTTAEALLVCQAPVGALEVLSRHSPAPGPDRRIWLLLQWQAADAGLDHRLAAQALRWLAEGDPANLEALQLPLVASSGHRTVTRPALDVLADHLESLGRPAEAAEVLLASRLPGEATAARWGRAVALAAQLDRETRDTLLERALEQAADSGAWGLVAQLLDQQLGTGRLDTGQFGKEAGSGPESTLALERRLRLSARIDDAYGEWLLRRRLASDPARTRDLETQLRSPRDPGGHAAGTSPTPLP
ncbi:MULTISPECIES: hypothetical protein [Aphanothece]|uniref:hypothetical protein n=1 Tax=Aphanothece TaxID=1121 RepID=UPI00398EBA70